MSIKAGLGKRIVTDVDVIKERIIVKGSTVYDVEEPTIILAQTNPPVLKSMLHKEVIVTYLTDTVRYGFTAELVEFIDYRLDSGRVEALVVKRTGPEKPYSVRMSYRVGPTGQSNISMSVFANKVDIIDISLGGTKFAYGMPFLIEPHDIAPIGLEIDGRIHTLEAHILRTWQEDFEGARGDLWVATIFRGVGAVTPEPLDELRAVQLVLTIMGAKRDIRIVPFGCVTITALEDGAFEGRV
jgi:hypothetical protein